MDADLRVAMIKKKRDSAVWIKSLEGHELIIRDRNGPQVIDTDTLFYVEKRGCRLVFHMGEGDCTVIGSMRRAQSLLDLRGFSRCGRRYLVSLKYVEGISEGCALVNGEQLPISRDREKNFLEALTDYLV